MSLVAMLLLLNREGLTKIYVCIKLKFVQIKNLIQKKIRIQTEGKQNRECNLLVAIDHLPFSQQIEKKYNATTFIYF